MNECSGATCSIYQNLKLLGYRSTESIEYKHIFGELALSITFQDFGGFRENFFFFKFGTKLLSLFANGRRLLQVRVR